MRFTEPHTPFIDTSDHSTYVAVEEHDVRALKADGIYIPSLLAGSAIGLIGLILFSVSMVMMVTNISMQSSEEPCPGVYGEDTLEFGDGEIYCKADDWGFNYDEQIKSIETADDHYKLTFDSYEEVYRWESLRFDTSLVVIGVVVDDWYQCEIYITERSLPLNFTSNDLYARSYHQYPDWCSYESSDSQEIEYVSDKTHPFLNEKLYVPIYDGYSEELSIVQTTNTSSERNSYLSSDFVEVIILEEIILGVILFVVSTVIFLKADHRRPILKFDVQNNRLFMRRSLTSTRWGGWSWNNVDYTTSRLVKERYSVSLFIRISGDDRFIARFGGDDGGISYLEPLKSLLEIEDNRVATSHSYHGYPTLELFDVMSWDSDNDGLLIYEWYLDQLDDRGAAVTRDEFYQGAGIASLSNYSDAQRLLNHAIELFESYDEGATLVSSETQVVEYIDKTKIEEIESSSKEQTNQKPDQLGAFWTQSDSEGN